MPIDHFMGAGYDYPSPSTKRGVRSVNVSFDKDMASVYYDPRETDAGGGDVAAQGEGPCHREVRVGGTFRECQSGRLHFGDHSFKAGVF